jgi:hypothetical protein
MRSHLAPYVPILTQGSDSFAFGTTLARMSPHFEHIAALANLTSASSRDTEEAGR